MDREDVERPETMKVWRGESRLREYQSAVAASQEWTISPGGAAAMLGVTRQAIWYLARNGVVRAWVFYGRDKRPMYAEFSVRDVLRHGFETGRLDGESRVGYVPDEEVRNEFDKWKSDKLE